MNKGRHGNSRANARGYDGDSTAGEADIKSVFKTILAIKGRDPGWASGVRRKSQCVRGEIKVKTSKLPGKPHTKKQRYVSNAP